MPASSSHRRPHRVLATFASYGDQLLVLEPDPFASEQAAPDGYELLSVSEAGYVLRTALGHDREALCALFCRVRSTSPYEQSEDMLWALEQDLGFVFPGDRDPPLWARILVARRSRVAPTRSREHAREEVSTHPQPALAQTWIGVRIVREDGSPISTARCTVETPDGEVRSLMTDADGRIRLERIAAGVCRVSFPAPASPRI
jgi:hypothetical protein